MARSGGRPGPVAARGRGRPRGLWLRTRRATAIGMDKTLFKRACGSLGLPIPPWLEVHALDRARGPGGLPGPWQVRGVPAILPGHQAGAPRFEHLWYYQIVHRPDEPPAWEHAVAERCCASMLPLAEPYLEHPRELEGERRRQRSPRPRAIRAGSTCPDASSTTTSRSTNPALRALMADLAPSLAEETRDGFAGEAFPAIGWSGFARARLPAGVCGCACRRINTIPGFSAISLFPRCAAREGGLGFAGRAASASSSLALVERAAGRPKTDPRGCCPDRSASAGTWRRRLRPAGWQRADRSGPRRPAPWASSRSVPLRTRRPRIGCSRWTARPSRIHGAVHRRAGRARCHGPAGRPPGQHLRI